MIGPTDLFNFEPSRLCRIGVWGQPWSWKITKERRQDFGVVGIAALGILISLAVPLRAQDDPFSGAADAPAKPAQANAASNAPELPPESNVVVLSIRDSKLTTPAQYGQAFVWLSRIDRYDEIGRYLDQIRKSQWSKPQLAQLLDHTDSALWLRISGRSELSNEQRAFAREVLDAAREFARSPEQLDKWVAALSDQSPGARAQARERLLQVDFEGLQRLAKAVAAGEVDNEEGLAAAVFEFGERGVAVLEELVVAKDPAVSERATDVLAKIGPFDSASALIIAMNRTDATEAAKKSAIEGLQRLLGYIPNVDDANKYLRSKLLRLASEAQTASGNAYDFRWVLAWNPETNLLSGKQVTLDKSLWSQADREARGLLLLDEVPGDVMESIQAIRLQNAFVDNPVYRDEVSLEKIRTESPAAFLSPEFLGRVLRISRDRGWLGSEIRALQLIGDLTDLTDMAPWIIEDIAAACGQGNPGVRYAAFETISKLDPQGPYAGSHRVLLTAVELLRVGPYPQVLVTAGFAFESGEAASKLRQYGMVATTTGSGRATLRTLDGPNPFELIVVASSVSDMPLSQLVQRISDSRYGSGIAILVVVPENDPARRAIELVPQAVCVETIPSDPLAMQELWEKIGPKAIPKLSADDRVSAAVAAGEFLKRVSNDSQTYAFYNLGSMESEVQESLSLPAGWIAADSVLASFGSAEAQKTLANRIADQGLDLDSRKRAAIQLVQSIRKHGVRVDRETVQLQYDRFNRWIVSQPQDAEPMGWILDAMEARAGMREWPDIPQLVAAPAE